MGVSAPAPPLSFVQAGRAALSGRPSLWGRRLEYCCGIRAVQMNQQGDCMRFGEKCQAMGRLEGLTMQRQSKSPRARPSTNASAVARLLAKGMLFWSHSREI